MNLLSFVVNKAKNIIENNSNITNKNMIIDIYNNSFFNENKYVDIV